MIRGMGKYEEIEQKIKSLGNPVRAAGSARYFKTGPGEYGEGDVFAGLTTPQVQALAREYRDLGLTVLTRLLGTKVHEQRTLAVLVLVSQYERGEAEKKGEIYRFYLENTAGINNWDLVDISAPKILGPFWREHPEERKKIWQLADSPILWERRMAMLGMLAFIRNEELDLPLAVAERLINDREDLMHKAVGWMLREMGKKDAGRQEAFLRKWGPTMPRTALRYAIEKFEEKKRKEFLSLGMKGKK